MDMIMQAVLTKVRTATRLRISRMTVNNAKKSLLGWGNTFLFEQKSESVPIMSENTRIVLLLT